MRILQEFDQRSVLRGFLDAFARVPCATLDPELEPGASAGARRLLQAAREAGSLRQDSLVFFTSGSTGVPRAVHRSAGSWSTSIGHVSAAAGLTAEDLVAIPGPLNSTLFLFGAWHARAIGARVALAGEPDIEATAIHVVPGMLPAILTRIVAGALPRLRTVVVAGDRLPAEVAAAVRSRGVRVVEYYGAAELSFVGIRDDDGPFRAFPGVEVAVRDGVLWSRSTYQAYGYLDEQNAGSLRRDEAGWASVGDLAQEIDGGFVVLGRGESAVTTGGHTVLTTDVEDALRRVPAVRDVAVVGLPHRRLGQRLIAAIVADAGVDDAGLRVAVSSLPRAARPRRFVRVEALPRTSAGKVDRAAVGSLLARRLSEVAS